MKNNFAEAVASQITNAFTYHGAYRIEVQYGSSEAKERFLSELSKYLVDRQFQHKLICYDFNSLSLGGSPTILSQRIAKEVDSDLELSIGLTNFLHELASYLCDSFLSVNSSSTLSQLSKEHQVNLFFDRARAIFNSYIKKGITLVIVAENISTCGNYEDSLHILNCIEIPGIIYLFLNKSGAINSPIYTTHWRGAIPLSFNEIMSSLNKAEIGNHLDKISIKNDKKNIESTRTLLAKKLQILRDVYMLSSDQEMSLIAGYKALYQKHLKHYDNIDAHSLYLSILIYTCRLYRSHSFEWKLLFIIGISISFIQKFVFIGGPNDQKRCRIDA